MPRIVKDDSQQSQFIVQLLGESEYDYDVPEKVLNDLNGAPMQWPARLSEWKLEKFLKEKAVTFAAGDSTLVKHMQACVNKLSITNTGSAQAREMIGEILGAVEPKNMGWTMVVGYSGAGHHGIDQIWAGNDEYLIVECKGGRGNLDNRQRYFEGCTHKGELGMNDSVTQMSTAWVFMGCNDKILGRLFTKTMLKNKHPKEVWLLPVNQVALKICLRLWNPVDFQIQGGALHYYNNGLGNLVAPTRHFNKFFGWSEDEVIRLPRVIGGVIKNGELIESMEYAKSMLALCEASSTANKRKSVVMMEFSDDNDKDDGDNSGSNNPTPHRFKPGTIPQMLGLNYNKY